MTREREFACLLACAVSVVCQRAKLRRAKSPLASSLLLQADWRAFSRPNLHLLSRRLPGWNQAAGWLQQAKPKGSLVINQLALIRGRPILRPTNVPDLCQCPLLTCIDGVAAAAAEATASHWVAAAAIEPSAPSDGRKLGGKLNAKGATFAPGERLAAGGAV